MPPTPSSCRRIRRPVLFLTLSVTLSLNAAAGLLWYSPMDGNANAVVGSNGTPVGSPSATTDRDGNAGSAGTQVLINAIAFATSLNAVPEPSPALLGLVGRGLLARRRR